jgi:hypothetical protein
MSKLCTWINLIKILKLKKPNKQKTKQSQDRNEARGEEEWKGFVETDLFTTFGSRARRQT